MTIINGNQVAGEKVTHCETSTFNFNVQKKEPREISNLAVGSVFQLPSKDDIFHNLTVNEDISVQVFIFCIYIHQ